MSRRLAIFLLSLTLLTGCGFKLRGNFSMPESLSTVKIEGGEREIVELLGELLEKSDSTVLEPGSDNAASVNITKSEYEREVLTSDAGGIASSYNFRYYVDFNVTDANGTVLQEPVSLNQLRTLDYEAGNELAIEDEALFLRAAMEKELVLQMLRRLSRL